MVGWKGLGAGFFAAGVWAAENAEAAMKEKPGWAHGGSVPHATGAYGGWLQIASLAERPEEVQWSLSVAEAGRSAKGFRYIALGGVNGGDRGVAQDEAAEQGRREGAAGAVRGGGRDVLAVEAVDFARREAKEIGGLGVVSAGGNDMKVRVPGGEGVGCGLGFGEVLDGEVGEGGELGPIGSDPGDGWEKALMEGLESGWI